MLLTRVWSRYDVVCFLRCEVRFEERLRKNWRFADSDAFDSMKSHVSTHVGPRSDDSGCNSTVVMVMVSLMFTMSSGTTLIDRHGITNLVVPTKTPLESLTIYIYIQPVLDSFRRNKRGFKVMIPHWCVFLHPPGVDERNAGVCVHAMFAFLKVQTFAKEYAERKLSAKSPPSPLSAY